ncbi:hypothetical protein Pelo_4263 [Pelomyxa schiedti]|nr:hypothetical protein Pelo_4263 [Pelomyxa schiedti]
MRSSSAFHSQAVLRAFELDLVERSSGPLSSAIAVPLPGQPNETCCQYVLHAVSLRTCLLQIPTNCVHHAVLLSYAY